MPQYKVLKKFGELKKGDAFVPENETAEDIAAAVEKGFIKLVEEDGSGKASKAKDISKVVFSIKNVDAPGRVSERVFDAETHGEDFVKVADEFGETNKAVVLSRKDE